MLQRLEELVRVLHGFDPTFEYGAVDGEGCSDATDGVDGVGLVEDEDLLRDTENTELRRLLVQKAFF